MADKTAAGKVAAHGDEEYEVESIVDHKLLDNTLMLYRVRWRGYASDDDTWEPRDNLKHCSDKLRTYEMRCGIRTKGQRFEIRPAEEVQPKDMFWENAQRGEIPDELAGTDKFTIVKNRSLRKGNTSCETSGSGQAAEQSSSNSRLPETSQSSEKTRRIGSTGQRKSRNAVERDLNASRKKASSERKRRRNTSSSSSSEYSTDYSWSSESEGDELDDDGGMVYDGATTSGAPSSSKRNTMEVDDHDAEEYEYIEPEEVASAPAQETTGAKSSSASATTQAAKGKSRPALGAQAKQASEMQPVTKSRTVELLAPYGLVKLTDPAELRTLFELPAISESQIQSLRLEAIANARAANLSLPAYLNASLLRAVHADDFEKIARICKLFSATKKQRASAGSGDAGASFDAENVRFDLDFEQPAPVPIGVTSASAPSSESANEQYTLVQVATMLGDAYAVDLLAQRGANLNARSKPSGVTALILAAERGFDEIVTLLISFGAHVNAVNNANECALYRAVKNEKVRCVEILLRCGANVFLAPKSNAGRRDRDTPLSFALRLAEKSAPMKLVAEKMADRMKRMEAAFADAVRAEVRGALVLGDGEKPVFPLQCVAVRDLDSLSDIFTFDFDYPQFASDFFENLDYGFVLFIARANLYSEKLELDLADTKIIDSIDLNVVNLPFITETYGFSAYSLAPLRQGRNQLTLRFVTQTERRSLLGPMYPVLSLVIGAFQMRLAELV